MAEPQYAVLVTDIDGTEYAYGPMGHASAGHLTDRAAMSLPACNVRTVILGGFDRLHELLMAERPRG